MVVSTSSERCARAPSQSVAALRRELELERVKSQRVDEMFRDLFGELSGGPSSGPMRPLMSAPATARQQNHHNAEPVGLLMGPTKQARGASSHGSSPRSSLSGPAGSYPRARPAGRSDGAPSSHTSSRPPSPQQRLNSVTTEPAAVAGVAPPRPVRAVGRDPHQHLSAVLHPAPISFAEQQQQQGVPFAAASPPSPPGGSDIEVIVEGSQRPGSPGGSEGSRFSRGSRRTASPTVMLGGGEPADAVLEQLSCLESMGPLMRRVFDEIQELAAEGSLGALPALREFTTKRGLEAEAWREAHIGAVMGQRFQSPFLKEEDVLFADEIVNRVAAMSAHSLIQEAGGARLNLRTVLAGPKDSGKSTVLHLFATRVIIPQLVVSGAWDEVFVVPINWDLYLGEAVLDIAVVYCHVVQHFVDLLVMQRPALRRWAVQIASYWKKAVTQTRAPTLPSDLAATFEGIGSEWGLHCALLQRCFAGGYCEEFLTAALSIPDLFRASLRFHRVLWLVDGVNSAAVSAFTTDGRGGDVSINVTVFPHLESVIAKPESFFVVASDAVDDMDLIKGVSVLPISDLISHDMLNKHYPGLPSILRCSGREYTVDVFRGCPGYLVPFIKLLEATAAIKTNKSHNMQRSVEFYGSAVEGLLERLSGLEWDEATPPRP